MIPKDIISQLVSKQLYKNTIFDLPRDWDIEKYIHLIKKSHREYMWFFEYFFRLCWFYFINKRMYKNKKCLIFLYDGDTFIGWLYIWARSEKSREVIYLYIDEKYRWKGIWIRTIDMLSSLIWCDDSLIAKCFYNNVDWYNFWKRCWFKLFGKQLFGNLLCMIKDK